MSDDYTVSLLYANWMSIVLLIPFTCIIGLPYYLLWGIDHFLFTFQILPDVKLYLIFLLILITGIIVHELLHGITWMIMGNKEWSDIKFGINWKALAPFAHCKSEIEVTAYRWGGAMPGLILGTIPYIHSLVTGNGWTLLFGYMFTVMATGDVLILWITRGIDRGALVKDHPSRAGCQIIKKTD